MCVDFDDGDGAVKNSIMEMMVFDREVLGTSSNGWLWN